MRVGTASFATALLFGAVACGGSSTPPRGTSEADATSVATYQDLSARVKSAAESYGGAMAASGMTPAQCSTVHEAYHAQVRPWMSQMVEMSGPMDAYIETHGGSSYADMACVAHAMLSELDSHHAVACTFPTLSGDQTEASRHAGVVTSYTTHVYDRCGQMMGGWDGRGYGWGPAAPGCYGAPGGTPTDPVALGERIFDWGIGTDGQPIVRTGGSMMMSGCAGCHGSDGRGRRTMMFTTPNITYANLTDPAGMLEPDGTRGPTYTDDLIRRAVVDGTEADGETLSTVMPRWQLADQDWDDLLLFLKTLH